ncbi:MAG TPA: hypothetical protein VNE39_04335 [Planctomycetota bacterium]|nr:hypothetical protein [Planctomycetota bacterium]
MRPLAPVLLALAILAGGCATTAALNEVKTQTLQQQERIRALEANCKMLENLAKSQEIRLDQASKLPAALESDVAAARGYAREIEKKVVELREIIAKQLDLQNARITEVRAAYVTVLQQQTQLVDTLSKTLDTALAELRAVIGRSLDDLKKALPGSDTVVPPAPVLPPSLRETPAPPAPPTPPPPLPPVP